MNILTESIEVQNAVKELMGLEEKPRGPDSIKRVKEIFDAFLGKEIVSIIIKD